MSGWLQKFFTYLFLKQVLGSKTSRAFPNFALNQQKRSDRTTGIIKCSNQSKIDGLF